MINEVLYFHFCLLHEIDDLELTLNQMKKAFRYVDEQTFILDITLFLTGELTLWEQSKIPIDYFTHKYENLERVVIGLPISTLE